MNKEDHYVLQEKEQEQPQPQEMACRYYKYALCFHGAVGSGSETHRDLCAGKRLKKRRWSVCCSKKNAP